MADERNALLAPGVSEFDFDPRERSRHRMIAMGMPDPNLSLGEFNQQALGNFGRQAMAMIPGLNSGLAANDAYQQGDYGRAVLSGIQGATEIAAIVPLNGRWSINRHNRRNCTAWLACARLAA